jgi:urease gamma subunit
VTWARSYTDRKQALPTLYLYKEACALMASVTMQGGRKARCVASVVAAGHAPSKVEQPSSVSLC